MVGMVGIGATLAGYRIERVLGSGASGTVYLAESLNPRLRRRVALKVLRPTVADDDVYRERFLREAQLAVDFDHHPSILTVYDAGDDGGVLYIAMRYVDGVDLKTVLGERGRLPATETLHVLGQIADALDTAHAAGLVHRDVKPANILLSHDRRRAYLADFGVAKDVDVGITLDHQFLGTVSYAAPEQVESKAVDGRADIYALGCVLFECLAGRPPFVGGITTVLGAHLSAPPPRLTSLRADLPVALDAVVGRALAKSPSDRYETCAALVDGALSAVASGDTVQVALPPAWVAPPAGAHRLAGVDAGRPAPRRARRRTPAGERPGGGEGSLAPSPGDPSRRSGRWRSGLVAVPLAVLLAAAVAVAALAVAGREQGAPPEPLAAAPATSEPADVAPGEQLWVAEVGAGDVGPVVHGDTAYVPGAGGDLVGLDVLSGRERFRIETAPVGGRPLVTEAAVYVGTTTGDLVAFDPGTHEELWRFSARAAVLSPPVLAGDTVLVGSDDTYLHAVDAATGERRWQFATAAEVRWAPAVVDGVVYQGSNDGNLYAVDLATGEERWSAPVSPPVRCTPTVLDGVVYVGGSDGALHAYDADDGTELWAVDLGSELRSAVAGADVVYAGAVDGVLHAVDVGARDVRWSFTTDLGIKSPPVVDGDAVYLTATDRNLYALDVSTGEQLWQFTTPAVVREAPAVGDGVAVLGSSNGHVYGVRTGRPLTGG